MKSKKILLLIAPVIAFGCLITTASASVQTPNQISHWPVDDVNNGLWLSMAASPETGNVISSFFYDDKGAKGPSIYTQLFNADGAAIASQQILGGDTTAQPAVAWNPITGGYIACWGSVGTGAPHPVRCIPIGADGVPTGSSQLVLGTPDRWFSINLTWSTAKKKFLLTVSDYNDVFAQWVSSDATASGSPIDFAQNATWLGEGPSQLAYSPTSNHFMVYMRGKPQGSTTQNAPWVWLLDGDGNTIGSPQRFDSGVSNSTKYKGASIVWNAARDQFVLGTTNSAGDLVFRRFSAVDGIPVGDTTSAAMPTTFTADRNRLQLASNPFADQLLNVQALQVTGAKTAIYSSDLSGDGVLSDQTLVAGGSVANETNLRPWVTFNPFSCNYLVGYNGHDGVGGVGGAGFHQLWTAVYSQSEPCRANLSVVKAGNGAGSVSGTATQAAFDVSQNVGEGTSSLYLSSQVSLTATAASGSVFNGWTGACTGTSLCRVSMAQAQTVTANFLDPMAATTVDTVAASDTSTTAPTSTAPTSTTFPAPATPTTTSLVKNSLSTSTLMKNENLPATGNGLSVLAAFSAILMSAGITLMVRKRATD